MTKLKNKKGFAILLSVVLLILITFLVNAPAVFGVTLSNPLGSANEDPRIIIGNIIKAALGITGSLALAIFVYGGIMWMFAGGNQERVKKGRDILIWAAAGILVVFSSYAVVKWLIDAIEGKV